MTKTVKTANILKKLFACNRCGYSTSLYHTFQKHLSRKHRCKPVRHIDNVPENLMLVDSVNVTFATPPVSPVAHLEVNAEVQSLESPIKSSGYLYMIRLREFIKTGENVYKVGKTTQELNKRIRSYPKQSELILAVKVGDCHAGERRLLESMRKYFILRTDYGSEYFEGHEDEMKKMFAQFL